MIRAERSAELDVERRERKPGEALRRNLQPGAALSYFVDVDNAGGARQAVEYLIGKGPALGGHHGRTAGHGRGRAAPGRLPRGDQRLRPPGDGGSDRVRDFSEASGAAAMRRLLEISPDLDAVLAAFDLMACGAIRALKELGRRGAGRRRGGRL